MSEQNILNPSATSLFNPDYGYTEGLPEMRALFQAQSGKAYARQQMGRGRTYQLVWANRDSATMHALKQWENQYQNDFFTLADWYRSRYFSGRFDGPLVYTPAGNEQWSIKGTFTEIPGLPMYAPPGNFPRDAIFLEERNGFGEDLVKLTGAWTFGADGAAHGGSCYSNTNLNTTDKAEWLYFGYGCQLWSETGPALGILGYTITRVRDGSVVATGTVDLYGPILFAAGEVLTVPGLPLDFYRFAVIATNTKNASSSAKDVKADALQVMQ